MFAFLKSCDFKQKFVIICLSTLVKLMPNEITNCVLKRRIKYLIKTSSKTSMSKSKRNFEIINELIVHKKCKQTIQKIVLLKDKINITHNIIYYML